MKTINLPPYAPTLMESTRAIGYSVEAAIADIIDNSLAAQATKIGIDFFPIGDEYVAIIDNGHGMTSDEITNAMQYGSKSPNDVRDFNDLGRYGLGLKTASLSQCRKLSVISVCQGKMSGRRWDLDFIQEVGEWSLLVLDNDDIDKLPCIEKLKPLKNGTLIIWQHLDKLSIGEIDLAASLGTKMDIVRDHLSLVFHRYLTGEPGLKKVELRINERPVIAADPFLSKKSAQIMDAEIIIHRGNQVIVKPYILPHLSKMSGAEMKALGGKEGLRRQQGFYVYRNKRLLVWGTWFRLMRQGDLSKLARVQVDIPNSLDDLWTLDIKKSTAIPPEEVRKNLSNIIKKITDGSKRTWTFRGKKEIDDSKNHLWNRIKARDGGIFYEINRDHLIVEEIIRKYPEIKSKLKNLLCQIEGTIPLNQLYIDLTNDEKINNDTYIDEIMVMEIVKSILDDCESADTKVAMLNNLKITDPFCEYLDIIDQAIENGELI
jgi:hypothetical protein